MKVLIHLSSAIISEAIRMLLSENGLEAHNWPSSAGFVPDIVLADVNTVSNDLFLYFLTARFYFWTLVSKRKNFPRHFFHMTSAVLSLLTQVSIFSKSPDCHRGRTSLDRQINDKIVPTESDLVTKKESVRRKKLATTNTDRAEGCPVTYRTPQSCLRSFCRLATTPRKQTRRQKSGTS